MQNRTMCDKALAAILRILLRKTFEGYWRLQAIESL